MSIDFGAVLLNLSGTPMKETLESEELTLGTACVNALLSQTTDAQGKTVSGTEKYKQADLAHKIYKAVMAKKSLCLSINEVTMLKQITGTMYLPIVVKRIWDLLDPSVEN